MIHKNVTSVSAAFDMVMVSIKPGRSLGLAAGVALRLPRAGGPCVADRATARHVLAYLAYHARSKLGVTVGR